jgi:hypothetical protein
MESQCVGYDMLFHKRSVTAGRWRSCWVIGVVIHLAPNYELIMVDDLNKDLIQKSRHEKRFSAIESMFS